MITYEENKKMQKFEKDTIVYVNTDIPAERCEIINYTPNESSTGANIYVVHALDRLGKFATYEENIFATEKEATTAYMEKSNKLIETYKNEIKDLRDLLNFPLRYFGDNYEARKAYEARAAELTDITL